MDVRPGGKWRYINRAADREEVAFYGEYLEVDPPRGFKWTFMFDVEGVGPMGGPETFILEEVEGGTKVTSTGHMGSVEELEGALATGMVAGATRDLGPPRDPARRGLTESNRIEYENGRRARSPAAVLFRPGCPAPATEPFRSPDGQGSERRVARW